MVHYTAVLGWGENRGDRYPKTVPRKQNINIHQSAFSGQNKNKKLYKNKKNKKIKGKRKRKRKYIYNIQLQTLCQKLALKMTACDINI